MKKKKKNNKKIFFKIFFKIFDPQELGHFNEGPWGNQLWRYYTSKNDYGGFFRKGN